MKEILKFSPIEKTLIWGRELWVMAAHVNGDSVVSEGIYKGETLSRLWDTHRELFGNLTGERFPLLIKEIQADTDLSIQVHPDDAYADFHEEGASGKNECWYILECIENASLVMGHHAKNRKEAEKFIAEQHWDEFIKTIPVQAGDFFQINAGCVHAIKGGIKLLEIQQNSDITYRLYDYNRLHEGKKRELHIEKSLDVMDYGAKASAPKAHPVPKDGYMQTHLVSTPFYQVEKYEVTGTASLHQEYPFLCLSVTEGEGHVDEHPLSKGDYVLLPYQYGEFILTGSLTCIASYIQF